MEEEFQLLNGESYELSSRFDEVFEAVGGDPRVKPELMQSIVEVATHVAETVPEAIEEARGLRARRLGCEAELVEIERLCERGSGADEQRRAYLADGSLLAVARWLAEQTIADV